MIADPFAAGLRRGWNVRDASRFERDEQLEADVAIVGSGAGGGTAAAILSAAGLRVLLLEEGPLRTSTDFTMLEAPAYRDLYQESAGRKTKDKGINILQGRAVGGSTTVNWTTSFRTPPATLAFWRERYALSSAAEEELDPWFSMMERRLNMHRWEEAPNENNDVLRRGAAKLGIPSATIHRNVKGCYNLGYCGMGCPTNAKQSMLVTTIPDALDRGASLVTRVRAERFLFEKDRVTSLECAALDDRGIAPSGRRLTVRAKHFVCAAGAIGTPALILRSALPDPERLVGKRTFLHPVVLSAAVMPQPVRGYAGAPQSVYSDHFLITDPIDGPIGYKLEAPPLHPLLVGTTLTGFGARHAALMAHFERTQVLIALMRDGFNEASTGGTVQLQSDGTPVLDYPVTPVIWDAARRALHSMADIQFAAGATAVMPVHESADLYPSAAETKRAIDSLPMGTLRTRVVSAHVMGGCPMGGDPKTSVVDPDGNYRYAANLSVFDGSTFPTSIGANPQLSIYGFAARNATALTRRLGKPERR